MSSLPNILWIYADELRADALGCYAPDGIQRHTPHLDRLAAEGVRFDACYCNAPVCVPSRTATLTGLYPEETGVYHNEACWRHYRMADPPVTLPVWLAQHGYETVNLGKVHTPRDLPVWSRSDERGAGMNEFYAHVESESLSGVRPPGLPLHLGAAYPKGLPYPPEQITERGLAYLRQVRGPFLLRLSYLQPHTPVLPPHPYAELYEPASFDGSVRPNPEASAFERRFVEVLESSAMATEAVQRAQAYYHGLVSWLDAQVGRVLDELALLDLERDTIVLFESDHGTSLGDGGRFQKQTFAYEVHRVPRLARWAGQLAQGQVRSDICEGVDIPRTLCHLLGLAPHAGFGGRALFRDPEPAAVYGTIGYGLPDSRAFPNLGIGDDQGRGWPRRACLRTARFRLDKSVRRDGQPLGDVAQDPFLVDRALDPHETQNRASDPAYVGVLAELDAQLDAHIRDSVEPSAAYTLP